LVADPDSGIRCRDENIGIFKEYRYTSFVVLKEAFLTAQIQKTTAHASASQVPRKCIQTILTVL
jgi:hypothetical protein